ncbi:mucin-5AC-like, partial [Argonauta hians]
YCNPNYYGNTCKKYCIPTDSYKCDKSSGRKICNIGWTGENCLVNQDDCLNNRCHTGSTCIDGVAYYTCLCPPGRTGTTCDMVLYKSTTRLTTTLRNVSDQMIAANVSRKVEDTKTMVITMTDRIVQETTSRYSKQSSGGSTTVKLLTNFTSNYTRVPHEILRVSLSHLEESTLLNASTKTEKTVSDKLLNVTLPMIVEDDNITIVPTIKPLVERETWKALDDTVTVIESDVDSSNISSISTRKTAGDLLQTATEDTEWKHTGTRASVIENITDTGKIFTEKIVIPSQVEVSSLQPNLTDVTEDIHSTVEDISSVVHTTVSSINVSTEYIHGTEIVMGNISMADLVPDESESYISNNSSPISTSKRRGPSTEALFTADMSTDKIQSSLELRHQDIVTSFLQTNTQGDLTYVETATSDESDIAVPFTLDEDLTDSLVTDKFVISDSMEEDSQNTFAVTEYDVTDLTSKTFEIDKGKIDSTTLKFDQEDSTFKILSDDFSKAATMDQDIALSTQSINTKPLNYYVSEDINEWTERSKTNMSTLSSEVTTTNTSMRQPTDHFLFTDFSNQFDTISENILTTRENIVDYSRENTTATLNQSIENSATLHTNTISKDNEIFYTGTKIVKVDSLATESSYDINTMHIEDEIISEPIGSIESRTLNYSIESITSIQTPDSRTQSITTETSEESKTDGFVKFDETVSNYSLDIFSESGLTQPNNESISDSSFTTDSETVSMKTLVEISQQPDKLNSVTLAYQSKIVENETELSPMTVDERDSTRSSSDITTPFSLVEDISMSETTNTIIRYDSTDGASQQTHAETENVTYLAEETLSKINQTEIDSTLFDQNVSDIVTDIMGSAASMERDFSLSTQSIDADISDENVSENITELTVINQTDISIQTSDVTMTNPSGSQPTYRYLVTDDYNDIFKTITTEIGLLKSENITDSSRENITNKLNYTTESSTSASSKTNTTGNIDKTLEVINMSSIYSFTKSILSTVNVTSSLDNKMNITQALKIVSTTSDSPKPNTSVSEPFWTRETLIRLTTSHKSMLPEREAMTTTSKPLTTLLSTIITTQSTKLTPTTKPIFKVCISIRIKVPKNVAKAGKIGSRTKLSKRLCWSVTDLSMFIFPSQTVKKPVASNTSGCIKWLSKYMTVIIPANNKYTLLGMKVIINWANRRLRHFFNFNWLNIPEYNQQFKPTCIVLIIKPITVGSEAQILKSTADNLNTTSISSSKKQQPGTLKLQVCRPAKQISTTTVTTRQNKTHIDKEITNPGNSITSAKRYYFRGRNIMVRIFRKNQNIVKKTLSRLSNVWKGVAQVTSKLYQPATNGKVYIRKLWSNAWSGTQKAYERTRLLVRKAYQKVIVAFSSVFDQARLAASSKVRQYYNTYRNYYTNYLTRVRNTAEYFKKNYDYYTKNLREYWNRYVN